MTPEPPKSPNKSRSPKPNPTGASNPNTTNTSKPYRLISLPSLPLDKTKPAGHDRFRQDAARLTGKITLTLTVETRAFVASGVVVMESDILKQPSGDIPLIKTAVRKRQQLIIPGSSLKGVVRSTYEAITKSCLCKVSNNIWDEDKNWISKKYKECSLRKNQRREELTVCPACRFFGGMDWQGLVRFTDAEYEGTKQVIRFMPSLYEPRPEPLNKQTNKRFLNPEYFDEKGKIRGRKFYYHFNGVADQRKDPKTGDKKRGIRAQQAGTGYIFSTQIRFTNLTKSELGTLLIVLGQDEENFIALKVGGGKPIGMGSMTVEISELELHDLNRYQSYNTESRKIRDRELKEKSKSWIEQAHADLVQSTQLQELKAVLAYPTDREPPEGNY